jgi:hypothetical protein
MTMGREGSPLRRRGPVAALARRLSPARVPVVPAVSVQGSELVHLGGGESFPCPDAPGLPIDPALRRTGLGTASLALPPARVHALTDVVVDPRYGTVRAPAGVVAESLTPDHPERPARHVAGPDVDRARELPGTVAVYRGGRRSPYHTMVEHLPRAALLAHPAMRRFGPITLLHDGPLDPLEAWLLPRLVGRHVTVRCVDPETPVRAQRVLLPVPVHRPGAGAVPSWFRRWADRATDVPASVGGRRVLIAPDGDVEGVSNRDELEAALAQLEVHVVDPAAADPEELVARCRDAEVVLGLSASALAHTVFSRRARVVELLRGPQLHPAIYYLAVSKGLPYDFVTGPGLTQGPGPVDVDALRSLLAR